VLPCTVSQIRGQNAEGRERSAFPALSAEVQKLGVPMATGQGKGDQEKSDSNRTHDVRNHGYRTGEIACVRPD
jgi:hypothetical protein